MTINLRRLARGCLLMGLAITPLLSFGELFALLRGSFDSQVTVYTPFYIKAIKDVLSVVLILLGLAHTLRSARTNRLFIPFLILFLYTLTVAVSGSDSVALALAGIRWIMPVFVAFFIYDFVDARLLRQIANLLAVMLIGQCLLQVGELYFMSHWYGAIVFGLAARVPGFFVIPITAGFFALTTLFFVHFYDANASLRRVTYFLAPLSVFMTQSGTGLVVLALMATLIVIGVRRIWLIVPIGAGLVVAMFPLLPLLTGREADYVAVSGGTRIEIFLDLVQHSQWIPTAFGYVTNTAVSLLANGGINSGATPTIVDSTYSSVLGNLGVFGGVFFALFAATWAFTVVCSRRLDLYVATALFGLYGFTMIVFEAYPMNILLAVLAAYFFREAYIPLWTGRPLARARRQPLADLGFESEVHS